MLLSRLLVRQKLNLLVVIPLVAVVLLSFPFVTQRVQDVRTSSRTARLMLSARGVAQVVEELQREQLLLVSYLASPASRPSPVLVQAAAVDTRVQDVLTDPDNDLGPRLRHSLEALDRLRETRAEVLGHTLTAAAVNRRYDATVKDLIDAIGLERLTDGTPEDLREEVSLDALLRADAAHTSEVSWLLAAVVDGGSRRAALSVADSAHDAELAETQRFTALAPPPGYGCRGWPPPARSPGRPRPGPPRSARRATAVAACRPRRGRCRWRAPPTPSCWRRNSGSS
ncbi:nitrate- and nitrite sensing domain-containing protein [Streptacidiphilus sp. ASG 303]|uniref:nitrate- and nitrite sensing domain-containing protein n=1 Tax=Streptacidiphilus sp. ASG 303 TaxID=2896847 RepID=UPI001E28B67F|nr:nitrate- and nitrite sensing domain-containing protein [Streptacidiphilus sp. ASG 303]MCD0484113.1 nitrate- and nitrite sensing domain-containing protein [Streptacidiphilus sp. ASG 303]